MISSFAVENRDILRQSYFEAKDQEDATGVIHYQTLLGDIPSSSQNQSSRERVSFIGRGFLEAVPKQFSSQVSDLRPPLLSRKLIEELKQGKPLSLAETTVLDANLVEAIRSHQQYVWYRLSDTFSYESTVIEFCRSFFISRPMQEERSIQSYLVLRMIDLTFCRKELRPTPEFVKEVRYLVICKVKDFVDICFSELEEELEEVTAGRREFRKEFFQTINKIRERAAFLCSKFSALETRPLLCGEEVHLVKQAFGLYETEVSYAMALDKVAGKKDYAEELRCMMALGKLYAKKREKQTLIQSAGMLNYALRLIEDPQYLPTMQVDTRRTRRAEILSALGRVEVCLLHLMEIQITSPQEGIKRTKASILVNRKNLQEIRKGIDEDIEKLGEEPTPQQIAHVHRLITKQMQLFTAQLTEQCIALLGKPPCNYAVIALGSMAREEMTHYSDLEFAILIEEGAEQHKEYFKNLTHLLHLKVINLGETILPALNIPCLNGEGGIGFFDGITPRGFALDGIGVKGKGCKTPLGNGITFELVQTPKKMAQYLGRDREGIDWPQKEPHLPMELLNCVLIVGDNSLCYSYREAVDLELRSIYREETDLRSYLARKHLVVEDEQQFGPALDDLEKEGQLFKVKQDLYRLPHLFIDRLALVSNLQVLSTFDRIKELQRIGVLNRAASEKLQWLICEVIYQRLAVYSHYKAQQEFMNPLIKAFEFEDPQLVQKQFSLNQDALKNLTKIYQILIPFYKAMRAYLKGDSRGLQTEVLWDESDFTLGQIAARFLHYEQARAYYLKIRDLSLEEKTKRLSALGTVELRLGKGQEALLNFQESLILQKKIYGKEHSYVAKSLNNIGMVYDLLGNAQKALSFFQSALAIWEQIYGKEHSCVAISLNNIGMVYNSLGKAQKALSYHQRALTIWEKTLKNEHPCIAISLNNIGTAYSSLGKAQQALSCHQKALTLRKKIYGEEHPYVAADLSNIGMDCHSLGKAQKALSFFQRALTIQKKIYGEEHSDVATTLSNIGGIYDSLEKAPKALSFHQRALIIQEKIHGKEHPSVARSLNNIGGAYYSLRKVQEALSFYERALEIWKKTYGEEHPDVAMSLSNIGTAYNSLGKVPKALSYLQKALAIRENIYGEEHSDIATSLNNIGMAYYSLGKPQEAFSCLQKALTIWEKIYGKEHPDIATSLLNIGVVYAFLKNWQAGLPYLQKALTIWEKTYGQEHPHVALSLDAIGTAHYFLGKVQEALSYYQKALTVQEKIYGQEHPVIANSLNNIGTALYYLEKRQEALSYYQRALIIQEKSYGKEHPYVVMSLNNIRMIYQSLGKT